MTSTSSGRRAAASASRRPAWAPSKIAGRIPAGTASGGPHLIGGRDIGPLLARAR
jgi:hypothetical protein